MLQAYLKLYNDILQHTQHERVEYYVIKYPHKSPIIILNSSIHSRYFCFAWSLLCNISIPFKMNLSAEQIINLHNKAAAQLFFV